VRRAAPLLAAALLAGCGSGGAKTPAPPAPKLPHAVAEQLLASLDDPAALLARTIRAVNAHRIPAALQEPLLSQVNALQADATAARRTALERWLRENSG
jgi:hypothetical protein